MNRCSAWPQTSRVDDGVSPIVDRQMYEYLTDPKAGLFQPTAGLYLERPSPEEWPQFSYVRAPDWMSWALVPFCKALLRRCENDARHDAGLPEVGAGWVSETELYQLIRTTFPDTAVVQHGRPRWLGAQHLDVYLPEYNIGIEYQGSQHDEPVDYFGGEEPSRNSNGATEGSRDYAAKPDAN